MNFDAISDFDAAEDFLKDNLRAQVLFKTWIPREKFIELLHGDGGISLSREDVFPIAFALGTKPPLRESWKRLNIESGSTLINEIKATERSDWQTYFIKVPTDAIASLNSKQRSDGEIEAFLKLHAPKSSVFPGNKEIVDWACVDEQEELVGVAAITRWESGEHVVVSVATHSHMRGRGIGAKVMRQVLAVAQKNSISRLCLGVNGDNAPAIALYEKLGWRPLFKFTYIERELVR